MTPLKWLFTSLIFIFLIFYIVYSGFMQNSATRTTAEAEALAESVVSGVLRGDFDDEGTLTDPKYIFKQEIATQLVNSLSHVQKTHPYEIEMNYIFLDEDKNVTEDEKEMKILHFEIFYKDEEGVVKGAAERSLALDALLE